MEASILQLEEGKEMTITSAPKRRVAVVGLGPAGAITIDALVKEECFDVIRVFERREGAGGCWLQEPSHPSPPPPIQSLDSLATRTADTPIPIPECLPTYTEKTIQPRFSESSIYPYLETNVSALAMEFTQEPFPSEVSFWSKSHYGPSSPFRHWESVRGYVQDVTSRHITSPGMVSFNTTVERAEKVGEKWRLVLRKEGTEQDFWWEEWFDAVVVASGHWSVPYIPAIKGLEEFERERRGGVVHSKHYRGREAFRGKRVVVVGASVSAADISVDLIQAAALPVHSVVVGHTANIFFGDIAFDHPHVEKQHSISHIVDRTVHFVDGTSVADVDHIIFGTGYSWTIPFLPSVEVRNNRVPNLYQHVVYQVDPSLLFIGAVGPGLTFKIFEWQAVLAARLLAGRTSLPPLEEMREWEEQRIRVKGDGPKFTLVYPDLEEYFETVRELAGEGVEGNGRKLVPFRQEWMEAFESGTKLRRGMWKKLNDNARRAMVVDVEGLRARTRMDQESEGVVLEAARL